MRKYLLSTILILGFSFSAYAETLNPYLRATEEIIPVQIDRGKAEIAAQALQDFYQSKETIDSFQRIEDGLGGTIVFTEDGVFSMPYDASSYDSRLEEFVQSSSEYYKTNMQLCMIFLIVFIILSLLSLCFVGYWKVKGRSCDSICAACVAFLVLLLFCFMLFAMYRCEYLGRVSKDKQGHYKSQIVSGFLDKSVTNGNAKFYHRNEVRNLLLEYADKYRMGASDETK